MLFLLEAYIDKKLSRIAQEDTIEIVNDICSELPTEGSRLLSIASRCSNKAMDQVTIMDCESSATIDERFGQAFRRMLAPVILRMERRNDSSTSTP